MIYAGIGSRETPLDVLNMMEVIGMQLAIKGWKLRSGSAIGADAAFATGARLISGRGGVELWTPYDATMPKRAAWFELAARFHPAWERCGPFAQQLHARNTPIVLGEALNNPARMVVCWTKNGSVIGGTGQALRIAEAFQIPVFNLYEHDAPRRLWEFVQS